MTQVTSAKSPLGDFDLVIGQLWSTEDGSYHTVQTLEMLPNLNAVGGNTRITTIDDTGEVHKCSFLDFVSQELFLVNNTPTREQVGGLQDHHLLDLYNTIAVGQRWKHYKGEIYVITCVSLDANVGVSDFNKAIISYRPLQAGKSPVWSLTVDEFLKVDAGVHRFNYIPLFGKDKRQVLPDQSLRYFWRLSA